jgi:iron(III) transport system permease protein
MDYVKPALAKAALAATAFLAAMATLWLADARVARLWLNTAYLAAGACLIALPLGTLAAVAVFKTDALGRRLAALACVGMLFVPLYLITGAWDAGFGILGWYTLSTNPHLAREPWLAGWRAAIWIHAMAAVPWVMLIVGAALRAVEAEIEEDAATCAAPARVIWHVSLRRAAPALAVAALWVAILASIEISATDFFQVRTFAEEVYTQSALGAFNAAATIGGESSAPFTAGGLWIGLALSAALALAVILVAPRLFAEFADAPHRGPWIWRLGAWRGPMTIVLWLIMLLVVGIPVANLMYKAGAIVTSTGGQRVRSWSASKVIERVAAAPSEFGSEIWFSAQVGAAAATAAVLIALPLAWGMRGASLSRRDSSGVRAPWLVLLAIALCLTIPGPLLGIGLIHLLNRPLGSPLAFLTWLYDDTGFAPWLAQTIRALPLATLILWPALVSVPQVMLDSAATDGTGWWGRLLRIAVPQRWPAVLAAWLVSFAMAVGELPATIMVLPPLDTTALSVRVFQLLHYGVDDRAAAICLVMMLFVATATAIAAALLKRKAL